MLVLRGVVRTSPRDGRIVFYSSHEMDTVEKISTRVIILRDGPGRRRRLGARGCAS